MSARSGVAVVGSFMMDLVATCERRPERGETVVGDAFEMFLGGKGFNQAVAAARSGAPTLMVGCLGDDDFGGRFLDALDREGIDRSAVSIDRTVGTGVGLPVVERSGQNAIVVIPRANHELSVADVRAATSQLTSAAVVLLQWELSQAVAVEAARIAHGAGVTVVLNPAPAVGDLGAFGGLVDIVVPNEAEAAALGGAATLRSQCGAGAIVLTLGERGAAVIDDRGERRIGAHKVDCVDTVGAGDAFCGAMVAALASGAQLFDAAGRGNAAGALAVTRAGAEPSMPTKQGIDALLLTHP